MVGHRVLVLGEGPVASALRACDLVSEVRTAVVVPYLDVTARPISQITNSDFEAGWERPMQRCIAHFQHAHEQGYTRIVAVVPTIGMSGSPGLVTGAATAEAVRVLVKSAARQWGPSGITVNCVAVAPALFQIDTTSVGTVSLSAPAVAADPADSLVADIAPLIVLLGSAQSRYLTGATLTADGGVWMSP